MYALIFLCILFRLVVYHVFQKKILGFNNKLWSSVTYLHLIVHEHVAENVMRGGWFMWTTSLEDTNFSLLVSSSYSSFVTLQTKKKP